MDDGAYLATKIVIKAAELKQAGVGLDVVLASLEEPKEAMEYRFAINREDFSAYADEVLSALETWAQRCGDGVSLVKPNYEGVRINFDNDVAQGWCLLRKSLHDPQMPLNIEVSKGTCAHIFNMVSEVLKDFDIS